MIGPFNEIEIYTGVSPVYRGDVVDGSHVV